MDANGTRYRLLLGVGDWGSCTENGVPLSAVWGSISPPSEPSFYWDGERNELTLFPQLYAYGAVKGERPRTPVDRRGAAADRFGNWYFIDPTGTQVLVWSSGSQTTSVFWPNGAATPATPRGGAFGPLQPAPPPAPRQLSGLAVTEHHYLIVGSAAPGALLVFDLFAGGDPRELSWPSEVAFASFDMAPAPGGGVWILDAANKRYWRLDARFAICGDTATPVAPPGGDSFQPLAGAPRLPATVSSPPGTGLLDAAFALSSANPIAIEALPDGTVLVLDRPDTGTSFIERYRGATRLDAPYPVSAMQELLAPEATMTLAGSDPSKAPSFTGQDLAFVPTRGASDPLSGRVLVALDSGTQTFAFASSSDAGGALRLWPLPDYYPMRLFGGRALVCANGAPYYDFTNRFVPLVAQKKPRYKEDGTLVTAVFDGGVPGCVWHRLILDACIPLDTAVVVQSRAADDTASLAELPFLPEPQRLVERADGSELPFVSLPTGVSSWELLFQRARGRYLQLQIQLRGSGRHTPRLRALRAYYPRFSYMRRYMPATYADSDVQGFLDRFLANLEGIFTPLEDRIAAVQVLFDPDAAPSDGLEWLASWFGVAIDPAWDDVRRRLFIRHVMDLFQWRGTVRGIQMALDLTLAANPCDAIFTRDDTAQPSAIRVVEQFRARLVPGVVAGDPTGTSLLGATGAAQARWTPDQGGAALVARWAAFATAAGLPAPTTFPVTAPSDASAATWTAFVQAALGFVPGATSGDLAKWTQFLFRRYSRIAALNAAYRASYASFGDVPLFTSLPPDGAPLLDWYQFTGVVLPVVQAAHRFRVLIPLPPGASSDSAQQQQRLDLVTRLVQLEKPAHTTFDVRFYWAMFRIGQVRLGYDTLLDQGSRVPALMPPMVLGAAHLSEGHLAPGFPQDATDRDILGRDALTRSSNA